MNLLLITIFSLTSISAFAKSSLDAKGVYESLKIKERNISVGEGVSKLEKSVGGLACTKSQVVYPGALPKYACSIDTNSLKADDVYEALNVKVNDISVGEGVGKFEKKLTGLSCTKSQVVYPGAKAKYSCTLSIKF